MAFSSIIRRGSSAIWPAIASRRAFYGAVSVLPKVQKRTPSDELRRHFLPFFRFSTAVSREQSADATLVRVLESEIDCAEQPTVADIPEGFPFEIQDNAGERTIFLKRTYHDETIKVEVDAPSLPGNDGDEDDDHDDQDDHQDSNIPPSLPLVVSITKGDGQTMEFGVTAFPDEISIDSMSIKKSGVSEDHLAYEGPDFNDLDENLQKGFYKYLEIRGIKPSLTNFLFDYMGTKDNKEYLLWLKNLKGFMEK
ncbi:Mitochondrial glycoprotein family protein [Euphorbia peplus]|nr:Mitochondrial glycoprotein family protein [Euphorbia peplus]